MVIKVERQLKLKKASKYNVGSSSYKPSWKKEKKVVQKEAPKSKDEASTKGKGKSDSQPSNSGDIKYFKCLGTGHIASQCPNKRVMIMRDNEVVAKSDSELSMQLWEKHL